jgi:hypothetical protein
MLVGVEKYTYVLLNRRVIEEIRKEVGAGFERKVLGGRR